MRFPRLTPVTFASSSDWFITLLSSVVIGQSNYFGFGLTTHLKTAPHPVSAVLGSDITGLWCPTGPDWSRITFTAKIQIISLTSRGHHWSLYCVDVLK